MPNRLIVVALAAIGAVTVAAQPQPLTVRITSPVDNEWLSGLVKMVAVVEPAASARQIKEVVFFADGRKICTLTRLPFECDWDAGITIEEHTVRVTVEMIKGGRTAASVHTKGLTLAESVDVDVLQFTAVVTDGDGRFVTGLKPSDFKIYDNDRLQKITSFESENISLELVAALDVSSSMRAALPDVKTAAKRFLEGLRAGDQVTVLGFNDNVFTLAPRSKDQAARVKAIDLMRAWGGTALYDVILKGLTLLGRHPGRKSMLLFSDGDDQSSHATLEAAIARAEGSDATIYVIGQGRAVRAHDLQEILKRFAKITGGRSFFTEDTTRLDKFFQEILEDLSNQYLISYSYPDDERDGRWHQIRVEVADGKYNVRARDGYRLSKN
ncbi:MAG: VWA domain-containing protein [Burkholderiales bacterium]